MSRRQTLLLCAAACIAAGCTTVGPDYSRPDPGLPSAYRGADAAPPAASPPRPSARCSGGASFPIRTCRR